MNYVRFGSGERTLVIIPGLSVRSVLLSEAEIESAYALFKRDFTVFLFDRRLDMPEGYKIRGMAEDTAAAMKAAGIAQADVFGVSQGGMIAQYIAIDHPELVNRLVLGSTTSRMRGQPAAEAADVRESAYAFLRNLYSDEFMKKAAPVPDPAAIGLTDGELARFAVSVRASEGFDAYGELRKIKCRTLVIGAANDAIVPPEDSAELAAALGCELYMYGAPYGHAVYDEAPDYKDRIYSFLMRD